MRRLVLEHLLALLLPCVLELVLLDGTKGRRALAMSMLLQLKAARLGVIAFTAGFFASLIVIVYEVDHNGRTLSACGVRRNPSGVLGMEPNQPVRLGVFSCGAGG